MGRNNNDHSIPFSLIFFVAASVGSFSLFVLSSNSNNHFLIIALPSTIVLLYFALCYFKITGLRKINDSSQEPYIADSVYYLGFLFTLVEVAVGIGKVAGGLESGMGIEALNPIAILAPTISGGLFATGLGLLCRAVLVWPSSSRRYDNPSQAMNDVGLQAGRLIQEMEIAVDVTNRLFTSQADNISKSNQRFQAEISRSLEEFNTTFKSNCDKAIQSVFKTHRDLEEMSKQVASVNELKSAREKIYNMIIFIDESVSVLTKTIDYGVKLNKSATNAIDDLNKSLSSTTKSLQSCENALKDLGRGGENVGIKLAAFSQIISTMETQAIKSGHAIETINSALTEQTRVNEESQKMIFKFIGTMNDKLLPVLGKGSEKIEEMSRNLTEKTKQPA
jgi:hypothetical protein